jgi:hypothetical protein
MVLFNQDTELEDRQVAAPHSRAHVFCGETLEKAKRFLLFVWGISLRMQGIREENLPPMTIVIPAGATGKVSETIRSLLGSQYRQLRIVAAGSFDQQLADRTGDRPAVRILETKSEGSRAQTIRSVLLPSVDPVFAWLEPGETLSFDTLNRVGRIFRGNGRVGGVVVQDKTAPLDQSSIPETEWEFESLGANDSGFSGKLFVRRECFWAAVKIFAGTDYDCNDWAVAMNTARFHRVKSIAGGYHRISGAHLNGDEEQNRNIRARVDASVWPTERLRQSIRKWLRRLCGQIADLSLGFGTWFARRAIDASTNECGPWIDCYVPPLWVKDLAGFSPGEAIALLGCYRRSFGDQAQEIRSVYLDRTTGILALRSGSADLPEEVLTKLGASPYQEYGERNGIVVVDVGSEMERQAEKLAKGLENLLQKVPELARTLLGDHLRISVSSDSPGRRREIEGLEYGADLVILPRLLNVFPRPLIALRQSVNSLVCGSLVAGCVAVPRRQLERSAEIGLALPAGFSDPVLGRRSGRWPTIGRRMACLRARASSSIMNHLSGQSDS